MDTDFLKIVGIVTVIIVACSWGVAIIFNSTFAGCKYEVVVTVVAVEKSTRFGSHTNVWALTYSGKDPLKYVLIGFHEFEIGKTYQIIFVNEYILLGWGIRGHVVSIAEVTA